MKRYHSQQWTDQSIQRPHKEIVDLNNTTDQMDLRDMYRTFHLTAVEYTFFSSIYGKFSRIDHILGHKTNVNKFKKREIISRMYSNHNGMKLEIITGGKLENTQIH